MIRKLLPLVLLLVFALVLAACTRSAEPSNPQAEGSPTVEGELPFPTSEFPPMDILETAAAATLTAQSPGAAPDATTPPEGAQPTAVPPAATATQETAPAAPTATPTPAPVAGSCESPYTVVAGDWVWKIGRNCGVDPNQIIALNNLTWPYLIYPGDTLILPES